MGLLDKLAQKRHEQGIDKKIKQAKELMAEEKYPAACSLLMELRHTHYGRNADRYRYDEVYKLHVECEDRSMDQAIEQAKALMAEGHYREAREVLREYVWIDVYRCDEANILYDACERAEAGEPQSAPAAAPKTAPAPKPEPKPAPAPKPEPKPARTESDTERAKRAFEAGVAAYKRGDHASAAKYFREAAELGDADAQFNLGLIYDNGKGVAQNKTEAAKWYRKAAEQGRAKAQLRLGLMYSDGVGVTKNKAEEEKWIRAAAEQGLATAQWLLGIYYRDGSGVPQNYKEALKWFQAAAEQGHDGAQFELGGLYDSGNGVPQNGAEAEKWYRAAAEQGNEKAQTNLAILYVTGKGVKRNVNEAIYWAEQAKRVYANRGDREKERKVAELLDLIKNP